MKHYQFKIPTYKDGRSKSFTTETVPENMLGNDQEKQLFDELVKKYEDSPSIVKLMFINKFK